MAEIKPTLPSAESAYSFLKGEEGASVRLIKDLLGRSAIIYLGMQAGRIAGVKIPDNAFALSLLGASAIELFVLVHISNEIKKQEKQNGVTTWSI